MGCRAKCERCNLRTWTRIVAGRRVCARCIEERIESKAVKKQGVRPWRKY